MAVNNISSVSYGLNQPTVFDAPQPIVSNRAPTPNDQAQIGTLWINKGANAVYVLTSITAGSSTWTGTAGAGEIVASITATTGPNSLTGITNINTAGAATTTIGTGGTGLVRIGNATGNTQVTGTLTGTALAATTTILAGTSVTAGTNIVSTAGNITANVGNITATAGNVTAGGSIITTGAGSAIEFLAGPWVVAGNGAPLAAAPQGTLYLRADGSSTTTRAYINTDGNTGWTSITTAA